MEWMHWLRFVFPIAGAVPPVSLCCRRGILDSDGIPVLRHTAV